MDNKYQTTTYVRFLGKLPDVDLGDQGVSSKIRFSFINDRPFDVDYVTFGQNLFAVYTVHVN